MNVTETFAKPLTQQLLRDEPVLRLSYTGLDGDPRVIPIAYLWDGASFRLWTIPISAKVRALEDAQVRALYERMVAITITPQWAKLIDFETNAPSAVEQLVRDRR